MTDRPITILLVDDDHLIRLGIKVTLMNLGYRVIGMASTGPQAILLAAQHRPSHILMDMRLKGPMDGVDAANEIRRTLACRMVFVTGSNEPDTLGRINTAAPDALLIKPVLPHELVEALGPPNA